MPALGQIMKLAEDGRDEAGAGDSLGDAERGKSCTSSMIGTNFNPYTTSSLCSTLSAVRPSMIEPQVTPSCTMHVWGCVYQKCVLMGCLLDPADSMHVGAGDSAIVVKDLPLEGESGDQGADDRLAAYDTQMGMLAEKARLEELSRGSGAEPDLLMDEAVKQAVLEHESAAQKAGGGQQEQQVAVGGADASAEAAGGAADDEYDDADYLAGQPQGSLEGEEGDEDSARRALLQSRKRKRAKKARNAEDIPGTVSRSLPAEVLPAEQEEAEAAGLQLNVEPQSRGDQGGGRMGDEDDRSIVMTDVSRAERQAENAVSDPGDSDNFEEGLLSATDEMGGRAVVLSQEESVQLEQLGVAESGAGDVSGKRTGRGKRKGRRKGRREGPRRAKARQSRKRREPEKAGAASTAAGGEPKLRRKAGKGKKRRSRQQGIQ